MTYTLKRAPLRHRIHSSLQYQAYVSVLYAKVYTLVQRSYPSVRYDQLLQQFVSVHSVNSLWSGYTYRIIRLQFRCSRTLLNAIFSSVIAAIVFNI